MTERERAVAFNRQTRDALKAVYEALNHGQRQKLLKNEIVKEIFDRYRVIGEEM